MLGAVTERLARCGVELLGAAAKHFAEYVQTARSGGPQQARDHKLEVGPRSAVGGLLGSMGWSAP